MNYKYWLIGGISVSALGGLGYGLYKLSERQDVSGKPNELNKPVQTLSDICNSKSVQRSYKHSNTQPLSTNQPPKEVEDYLKQRTITLFAPNNGIYSTDTYTPPVIFGIGFILGPATQQTEQGSEHVYYVGSDMASIVRFSDHRINNHYYLDADKARTALSAISDSTTSVISTQQPSQKIYKASLLSSWKYQATNIKFNNIDHSFCSLPQDQLGVNFGVIVLDLDPNSSSRKTDQVSETNQANTGQHSTVNSLSSHVSADSYTDYLNKLKESVKKYSDISINGDTIDRGYMLDYAALSSSNPTAQPDGYIGVVSVDDLGDKLTKRVYHKDDKVSVSGKDYYFPTNDYHTQGTDVPVGSVLVSYDSSQSDDKVKFKLGGFNSGSIKNSQPSTSTLRQSLTNAPNTYLFYKLWDSDNYDAISKSSDSESSLCKSIEKNKSLKWTDKDITLRLPSFCN